MRSLSAERQDRSASRSPARRDARQRYRRVDRNVHRHVRAVPGACALDGTLTVTVAGGQRTVTRLALESSGPELWDTDGTSQYWALGVAGAVDGPLLNDFGTAAVDFTVADGASFVVLRPTMRALRPHPAQR